MAAVCTGVAGCGESPPGLPPPDGLRCLLDAYPGFVRGIRDDQLVWRDGTRTPWDDGRPKTWSERLADPDLEDQMALHYPFGPLFPAPARDADPGRARHLPLFQRMYGRTQEEVESRLVEVDWLPGVSDARLTVTRVNFVDEHLRAVSRAVLRLPAELRQRVADVGGGYNWRTIAGTDRQSPHSFGIAVDVGLSSSDYWRTAQPEGGEPRPYHNRIPLEVVEAFEREGFVWGGKWYHYDTMHFEYRPELLVERCRADQSVGTNAMGPSASGGRTETAGSSPASACSTQPCTSPFAM